MRIPLMKYMTWYLAIAMFIIGIAPRVDAGLAPSEILALTEVDRTAHLEKIQKVLEMKVVTERLAQLGLTQDEIQKRLHQLSDQQIHQIALQLDELKVGGDALGVIIALLVIVLLVVLIIQLTGHKVIVTK
ncbi:MAG: PA2779 family protein [Nitrospirae bacterium]|nr:PA2779 family protein [Nitrospirota bacterium]